MAITRLLWLSNPNSALVSFLILSWVGFPGNTSKGAGLMFFVVHTRRSACHVSHEVSHVCTRLLWSVMPP